MEGHIPEYTDSKNWIGWVQKGITEETQILEGKEEGDSGYGRSWGKEWIYPKNNMWNSQI